MSGVREKELFFYLKIIFVCDLGNEIIINNFVLLRLKFYVLLINYLFI